MKKNRKYTFVMAASGLLLAALALTRTTLAQAAARPADTRLEMKVKHTSEQAGLALIIPL
jgi:hypothetical protein